MVFKKLYFFILSLILSYVTLRLFFENNILLFILLPLIAIIYYIIRFRSLIVIFCLILGLFIAQNFSGPINSGNWPSNLKDPKIDYKVLIIVDELDAIDAKKMIPNFIQEPFSYSELDRIAYNTADAFIRLFFPSSNLNQISPCGIQTLCDGIQFFRFNSVFNKEISEKRLYSGFYFPGCRKSINEECHVSALIESPLNSLQCYINRNFKTFFVDSCKLKYQYFIKLSESFLLDLKKFINVNKSGYIILHVPISHPPGPTFVLDEDLKIYNKNVTLYINDVLKILQNTKFELDVISDHPLRTEIWCYSDFYNDQKASCSKIIESGYGKRTPIINWK